MKENESQSWNDNRQGKPNYTERNLYPSRIYTINPAWTAFGLDAEQYLENF
jgi:hypothetical protein